MTQFDTARHRFFEAVIGDDVAAGGATLKEFDFRTATRRP